MSYIVGSEHHSHNTRNATVGTASVSCVPVFEMLRILQHAVADRLYFTVP